MADEDKKDVVDEKGTSDDKTQTSEEKLVNLEKKIGQISQTIDDQNKFIDAASVVINTLAYTPELREHFQKVVKGQMGGEGADKQENEDEKKADEITDDKDKAGKPDGTNNEASKTEMMVQDVEASQRESIITQFEKDLGISGLEEEKQKEVRKQISGYLNDFGWNAKTLPLVNLRPSLEKAYLGTVGISKLKEEGKLEGITMAKANSNGVMSQISGVPANQESQEADLTPKQKEFAEKLHVDPEKAKKTFLARDQEQERTVEVKEEK